MTYYMVARPFLKIVRSYCPIPAFKNRGNHAGIYSLREGELFTEREMFILGIPFEWTERIYINDGEVYMSMGARFPF